jgi:Suppressor of fused protein (SUFU)
MPAPPIARAVYHAHVEHFGEPDESITYDDPKGPPLEPSRIDVMIWRADAETDITTFATIGMCTEPMAGAAHRAELHFAVRRHLGGAELRSCSRFLANLATYPFHYRTHLDWWHRMRHPGEVPLFPSARAVLFHPRFVPDGWDTVETEHGLVKLLNAVPLNEEEARLKQVSAILDAWAEKEVDVFRPR